MFHILSWPPQALAVRAAFSAAIGDTLAGAKPFCPVTKCGYPFELGS
jgi:hypothetical protein